MNSMDVTARSAAAERWVVVAVDLTVDAVWGMSLAHGRFDRVSGSYEISPERAELELRSTLPASRAAGNVVPVQFDAAVQRVDQELQIAATATVDRHQLGKSGSQFGLILPARVHVLARFGLRR
jgi:hypothetical protein